jgi:hypothetical protein
MGYENASHETLGAELLAVLHTMKFPEEVLGHYWSERLKGIVAEEWYPVAIELELQQQVLHRGGRASLVQLGRQLFRDLHQARLSPLLRSAGDVLHRLDRMYRHGNRGRNIGGWELVAFAPGQALLRKKTPQHCALDEGLLHEALQAVGTVAMIVQPTCVLTGGKACELELRSTTKDHRWMGEHPPKLS